MRAVPTSSHRRGEAHHPEPGLGPSDDELVAAARADPRAFSHLYERYLGPIYGYCYLRSDTREAAEDATGEVFLKALAKLGQYRGGSFSAWLFRIAHNAVVDARRRRPVTETIGSAVDPADPDLTPEEVAVARDEAAALRSALARLPRDQRTVIELQLSGWSGEQIASAMGRSVGAVKQLRYRAVEGVRGLLSEGTRGSQGGPR